MQVNIEAWILWVSPPPPSHLPAPGLQWKTSKPTDVHWDSRRSLLATTCLLPGAQNHGENGCYGESGSNHCQHKGLGNSTSSWKQHGSQVCWEIQPSKLINPSKFCNRPDGKGHTNTQEMSRLFWYLLCCFQKQQHVGPMCVRENGTQYHGPVVCAWGCSWDSAPWRCRPVTCNIGLRP